MKDKQLTKIRIRFEKSRKQRPWLLVLGIVQLAGACVFGRAFALSTHNFASSLIWMELPKEEVFPHLLAATVVLVGLAIGTTVLGVASIHYVIDGLIENPRDVLLSYLLEQNQKMTEDENEQPDGEATQ